jgi:hypothetical protein
MFRRMAMSVGAPASRIRRLGSLASPACDTSRAPVRASVRACCSRFAGVSRTPFPGAERHMDLRKSPHLVAVHPVSFPQLHAQSGFGTIGPNQDPGAATSSESRLRAIPDDVRLCGTSQVAAVISRGIVETAEQRAPAFLDGGGVDNGPVGLTIGNGRPRMQDTGLRSPANARRSST